MSLHTKTLRHMPGKFYLVAFMSTILGWLSIQLSYSQEIVFDIPSYDPFAEISSPFSPLTSNVFPTYAPAFTDVTGDGFPDAFIGTASGEIFFFVNNADGEGTFSLNNDNNPLADFNSTLSGDIIEIHVSFADVNGDNVVDAIIGYYVPDSPTPSTGTGRIAYFEGVEGTGGAVTFTRVTTNDPFAGLATSNTIMRPVLIELNVNDGPSLFIADAVDPGNLSAGYEINHYSLSSGSYFLDAANDPGFSNALFIGAPPISKTPISYPNYPFLSFGNVYNSSSFNTGLVVDGSTDIFEAFISSGGIGTEVVDLFVYMTINPSSFLPATPGFYRVDVSNFVAPSVSPNPFTDLDLRRFNILAFSDVDGDDDLDLFIGGTETSTLAVEASLNAGDASSPDFSVDFNVILKDEQGLDFSQSKPVVVDWNNDGREELIVGNANEFFYFDIGQNGILSRNETEDPFASLTAGSSINYAVTFADLTGDGLKDAIVGAANFNNVRKLNYFINRGNELTSPITGDEVDVISEVQTLISNNTAFVNPTPALSDIDGDGVYELFVSYHRPASQATTIGDTTFISYYERNESGSFQEAISPINLSVEDVSVSDDLQERITLTFADIDVDGDEDAFIGTANGQILYYQNNGSGTFTRLSGPDYFLENLQVLLTNSNTAATAPGFGDLDGDGDLDLLVGSGPEGIVLVENISPASISVSKDGTSVANGGTIDLGSVELGETLSFTIDIANDAFGGLVLENLSIDQHSFDLNGENSLVVAPKLDGSFAIDFTPTETEMIEANLTFDTNVEDQPNYSLTLRAEAITPPEITVKRGTADILNGGTVTFPATFGTLTSSLTLTISNEGTETLNLETIELLENDTTFSFISPLPVAVNGGEEAELTIQFEPKSIGLITGMLRFATNDSDENSFEIQFQGEGLDPGLLVAEFELTVGDQVLTDGETLDFGTLVNDKQRAQVFTLSNTGLVDLEITDVQLSNSNFSFVEEGGGVILSPSESRDISITTASSIVGDFSSELIVTTFNDEDEPQTIITLTATRSNAIVPVLSVSGGEVFLSDNATVIFPETFEGQSSEIAISIENIGNTDLNVSGASFDPNQGNFSLSGDFPATIAPDMRQDLTIRFTPRSIGALSSTFSFTSDDPDQSTFSIRFEGEGLDPALFVPALSVINQGDTLDSNAVVDFGSVTAEQTATQTLTIYNGGIADLIIENISDLTSVFSFIGDKPSGTIAPGMSVSFEVQFQASANLIFAEVLTITTNDPDVEDFNITLQGTGLYPEIRFLVAENTLQVGDEIELPSVDIDGTSELMVLIENSGTDDLEIKGFTLEGEVFVIRSFLLDSVLAPGESYELLLGFTPPDIGRFEGSISVVTNVAETPVTFDLIGASFLPEVGVTLTITEDSIINVLSLDGYTYGSVEAVEGNMVPVSTVIFSIRNTGLANLVISDIDIQNESGEVGVFTNQTTELGPVAPMSNVNLGVNFTPNVAGTSSAVLTFSTNDPDRPEIAINLSGELIILPAPPLGLSDADHIQLFPNPSSDLFHVSGPIGDQATLSITDLTGRKVLKERRINDGQSINVSTLEEGVYSVHLILGQEVIVKQLIIRN